MIVLDTNILSELMKPEPESKVLYWFQRQVSASLFTTTISQAEILYGVALLPEGKRRAELEKAVEGLFEEDFFERLLSFDKVAAQCYATIVVGRRQMGRPISQSDAQIAAIAHSRGAAIATRNDLDFTDCHIEVINPWNQDCHH